MIFPVLSHFDNRYGPRIIFKAPDLKKSFHLNHIPFLMDLFKDGFFIHEYGAIRSINLIFEIESPLARGKAELLQISLICFDKQYDLSSFNEILATFVSELRNIHNAYRAFHFDTDDSQNCRESFNDVAGLFSLFNQSLPKEKEKIEKITKKFLTFGLSLTGKTNIIRNFQENLTMSRSHTGNRIAFKEFTPF